MPTANEIREARAAARYNQQFEGSEAECESIIAAEDLIAGYPAPGTNVGRGPHEAVATEWDGEGDPPAGWTATYARPEQHPTDPAKWAVPMRGVAMRDRVVGRMHAGRLITAADIRSRAPDWTPAGQE